MFREENYRYLYESARNYAGLLEKEFKVKYEPREFRKLFEGLDEIIPYHLQINNADDKLYFSAYKTCHSQQLFYLPCRILENTSGRVNHILLEFFRILKWSQKLQAMKDSYHVDGLFQELDIYREEGAADEYIELLQSYQDGDIGILLDQVNEHPAYNPSELLNVISGYTPSTEKEKELLEVLAEGLSLMRTETSILKFSRAFDFDPESDYSETPMGAEELIMIVYDDDYIVEQMIESVNMSCESCESELFCAGEIDLTPGSDQLMEINNYVIEFLDYLIRLSQKLYEYDK
ncbi:hypothetical protein [Bacteroides sp. 51]|uniref:hypothetical protein n=1 Tax=Bacteroides sp. 51 TaxID=2302938 RepID=UPI0013D1B2A6|nr:hypothetical protein [Bacteroides sp. 51]NDV81357.1 hypothetical protein [Bacteroides sp. 51]